MGVFTVAPVLIVLYLYEMTLIVTPDAQTVTQFATFEDVLRELDDIIAWSLREASRIGFFAAIYKNVTARIKQAAANGEFQDAARIELLDVTFASRYFAAVDDFRNGRQSSGAWSYALAQSHRKFAVVLQQLLLSMNPHINIDLAVATSQVSGVDRMLFLYDDFLKVNQILADAMVQIEKEVFSVSPLLSLVSKLGMKPENRFFNFSLDVARCEAWSLACQLVTADAAGKEQLVNQANQAGIALGKKIVKPGILGSLAVFFVGILEVKSIRKIIQALERKTIR